MQGSSGHFNIWFQFFIYGPTGVFPSVLPQSDSKRTLHQSVYNQWKYITIQLCWWNLISLHSISCTALPFVIDWLVESRNFPYEFLFISAAYILYSKDFNSKYYLLHKFINLFRYFQYKWNLVKNIENYLTKNLLKE